MRKKASEGVSWRCSWFWIEGMVESGLMRVGCVWPLRGCVWPLRGCLGVGPSFSNIIGAGVGGSSGSCTTKASIDSARL